jgi:uncharacterized protein (DUF433 family)
MWYAKKIIINAAFRHGKPRITGARVPVSVFVISIAQRDTLEDPRGLLTANRRRPQGRAEIRG